MAIPAINTIKHQNLMQRLYKKQEQFEEALKLVKGDEPETAFVTYEINASPTRRSQNKTYVFGVHYSHLFIDDFVMIRNSDEIQLPFIDMHKWRR